MMKRPHLLTLNLATDADDPVLGFTTSWVRALAAQAGHVDVITMRAGRLDLPSNVDVWSLGKERGYSEPRRLLTFYATLARILARDQIDLCFAHMAPLFAVLAAPLLAPRRIPIITWYAHPHLSNTVRLAHAVSSAVVTSLPSAYPYKRDKLHVIGQGIDPAAFAPTGDPVQQPPQVLCAGRLSAVKDHSTLIRAVALLNRERPGTFVVGIVGSPARREDETYVAGLKQAVHAAQLDGVVTFHGSVVRAALPGWYSRSAVHVNLTPAGFGDKVALEAMSCGTPCITANEDFKETLGKYADVLLFTPGDSTQLADRLRHVLSLSASSRADMGAYLREQVIRLHSLEQLATRVLAIGRELTVATGRRRGE